MVLIHFTKKSIDYPFLRSRGLPSWTGNGQLTSSRSSTPPAQFGRATDAAGPGHHGLGSSPIGVPIGDAVRHIRQCTPCVYVCVCVCVCVCDIRCFGRATFEGESATSTCQESGLWSHPVPRCLSKIATTLHHRVIYSVLE